MDFTDPLLVELADDIFPPEFKEESSDEIVVGVEELFIYLHALRYETDKWAYESELPDWAAEDYEGDMYLKHKFWDNGGKWKIIDGIDKKSLDDVNDIAHLEVNADN